MLQKELKGVKAPNFLHFAFHISLLFANFANDMKVLNNIKAFVVKVMSFRGLKYILVCLLGVLIIGFLDENSVWSHLKNQRRIGELQEEIDKYNAQHNKNQAQIRKLNKDPKAMEKIARERYFMKADDEDIFVLSDDVNSTNTFATDESAE